MLNAACGVEVLRLVSRSIFSGGEAEHVGQVSVVDQCSLRPSSADVLWALPQTASQPRCLLRGDCLRASSGHPRPPQTVLSVLPGDGGRGAWNPLQA